MNPLDAIAIGLLVIAVILGTRSGALPQIGGLVGAGVGAVLAVAAIPTLLPHLDSVGAPLRVGAVLLALLLFVGGGEMLGARGGRSVSRMLGSGILGALDRVAGGLVGAGQAVLIVWLMGGILAAGLLPALGSDARTSLAIRGVGLVLPPPTEIVLQIDKALYQSGLPGIILGIERLPADPVQLPTAAAARALGSLVLNSVPRVEADTCAYRSTGTGIVVKAGYVVTNAHVIAGARAIRVFTARGDLPARAVFVDPDLDVALLRVTGLDAGFLVFATSDPQRGSSGATIGYPNGGSAVIGPAAVTDTYQAQGLDIEGRDPVTREIVELQAIVDPGDSGGPFVLTNGTVGGLVFAESRTDKWVGYALSPTAVAAAIAPALTRTAAVPTGSCLH
ncbi:MAG: MarP family serine protease [Chloroflexi bacterium]|nr:MarP family serine protease [Chloroflexota bacterium]